MYLWQDDGALTIATDLVPSPPLYRTVYAGEYPALPGLKRRARFEQTEHIAPSEAFGGVPCVFCASSLIIESVSFVSAAASVN